MKTKYNINDKFVFIPKNNALIKVDNENHLITLGTNESRLLEYIVERRNTTVSRHELISILWNNRDIYVDDSSLTQSVSTLRKTLGDSTKLPIFIKTVPKVGYEFIAPANRINVASAGRSLLSKDKTTHKDDTMIRGTLRPQVFTLHEQLVRFEVFVLLLIATLVIELLSSWYPK